MADGHGHYSTKSVVRPLSRVDPRVKTHVIAKACGARGQNGAAVGPDGMILCLRNNGGLFRTEDRWHQGVAIGTPRGL